MHDPVVTAYVSYTFGGLVAGLIVLLIYTIAMIYATARGDREDE